MVFLQFVLTSDGVHAGNKSCGCISLMFHLLHPLASLTGRNLEVASVSSSLTCCPGTTAMGATRWLDGYSPGTPNTAEYDHGRRTRKQYMLSYFINFLPKYTHVFFSIGSIKNILVGREEGEQRAGARKQENTKSRTRKDTTTHVTASKPFPLGLLTQVIGCTRSLCSCFLSLI